MPSSLTARVIYTGAAGSGESNIHRWIIENDYLEAVITLPNQMFYNTGIFTYIWIVSNRKPEARQDKVQLINAVDFFLKMKKSLGDKRNEIDDGKDGKNLIANSYFIGLASSKKRKDKEGIVEELQAGYKL